MPEEEYLNLIARALAGALSPEERERLEAWKAADPRNRELAEKLEFAWKQKSPVPAKEQTEKAYQKLQQRIRRDESEAETEDRRLRYVLFRSRRLKTVLIVLTLLIILLLSVIAYRNIAS